MAPNEAAAITPAVEKALEKGIPVIMVDRKIQSNRYTAFIGADNYKIGQDAGIYILNMIDDNPGKILEITGLEGSTPALERHNGFMDVVNKASKMEIFGSVDGGWLQNSAMKVMDERGLKSFERIAKEGRKYGVSLVVISQRPADVSKTILSQCGNFIAMRLTNPEDQNVIRRLFPDNLGDFAGMLPILDVGEGLVVGDASLLPSRVILDKPTIQPNSCTVDFWDIWNEDKKSSTWEKAVNAMRQQQKL